MKKILVMGFISLMCFTGCSKEDKVMTCTRTVNQNSLKFDLEYKVTYQGKYVKMVNSTEKIISSDEDTLKQYKESLEKMYSSFTDLDYYDNKITVDGDTLTSTVDINYEKIDTDKMIDIDSSIGQIIQDGKIKVSDMKKLYESAGASCSN